MLQMHEKEISLRKWSDGAAQLRTLEGTLRRGIYPLSTKNDTYEKENILNQQIGSKMCK